MTTATLNRSMAVKSTGTARGRARELRFRFSDVNDLTGRPFAQSRFRDLPGFVADVVVDQVALEPGEWDELVKMGEAYDFVGFHDSYPVPHHVAQLVTCPICGGNGENAQLWKPCGACDGTGEYFVMPESMLERTRRRVDDTLAVVA
jgi:hypothetical protein